MKTILVVAAHPDDELLGCAGTVARHVSEGDKAHVIIMAEGATSRAPTRNRDADEGEIGNLRTAASKAAKILGVSSTRFHDFPDNRMDSVDLLSVVKKIEVAVEELKPSVIYTHHASDVNVDHNIVHRAVLTACRPLPGAIVEQIFAFETVSSTEWMPPASGAVFTPNWFVDISSTLDRKLAALAEYETEMRDWPHARSLQAVRHLAHWRGATIGTEAAEAFSLVRAVR